MSTSAAEVRRETPLSNIVERINHAADRVNDLVKHAEQILVLVRGPQPPREQNTIKSEAKLNVERPVHIIPGGQHALDRLEGKLAQLSELVDEISEL